MGGKNRLSHARIFRKRAAAALAATGALVMSSGLVVLAASSASAGGGVPGHQHEHKTSICHRTASDSNPYVFEKVDDSSLDAHFTNMAGHPAKSWTSAGTWRGVAHKAGDPRNDYAATTAADCEDTTSPPVDVCSNIDGVQTSIPSGYHGDGHDGCAPDATSPADVCNNIDGVQTSIPSGYHGDGHGGCVQNGGTPPVDVCNNIPGDQATIPGGFESDGKGGCVKPVVVVPTDVCTNLPGVQAEAPKGYEVNDGECAQVLGVETMVPQPKPTKHAPAVRPGSGPRVLGTEAIAPTAVDAGLASWPTSHETTTSRSLLAQGLVGGGLLMLVAGGWLGFGTRKRGAYQA